MKRPPTKKELEREIKALLVQFLRENGVRIIPNL